MAHKMTALEYARRQRRWSQKDLAEHPKIRIHQSYISAFERGALLPVDEQRERLAKLLNIPADRLLEPIPDLVFAEDAEMQTAAAAEESK